MFKMDAIRVDKTDEQVLAALKENSRATVRQIAKQINTPITTVHSRLKRLTKEGIINRFTIEPNYEKLGKGIAAFVFASISHEKLVDAKSGISGLKKRLKGFPEVEHVYAVTGETDLILLVRVGSINQLDEFLIKKLRNITGIVKTTTLVVLEED